MPAAVSTNGHPQRIPKYKRLDYKALASVIALHNQGKPQTAIAHAVGCDPTSVNRALSSLIDTRELAIARARAASADVLGWTLSGIKLACEAGKPESGIKVLEDLGVLPRAEADGGGTRIAIIIGEPERPLRDPFAGQVIDVKALPEGE